jgi:hypothetical protein
VNCDFDVVKLVVDPPVTPSDQSMKKMFLAHASVQFVLTLEAIWRFRNQHGHQANIENPIVSIKNLECRISGHFQNVWPESSSLNSKALHWSRPPSGIIKLNVDAAILPSTASIVVIAQNDAGLFIKAWAKAFNSCDPLVAEAADIRWAVQLDKMEDWRDIIIERNSKVCVDVIFQDLDDGDWNIFVLCTDAKVLAADFSYCLFCWVKREAYMMSHTLAKILLPINLHV